jgi:uncharacterized membrane protein YfcA
VNVLELSLVLWAGAVIAGLLGSLTGLGGGVVIVPLLSLGLGIDIRYAIGTSLIAVIATSSGAAIAFVRDGFSNIRVGMLLEIATTLGATAGALLAHRIPTSAIAVLFGIVLLASAIPFPPNPKRAGGPPSALAARLHLNGTYPSLDGVRDYEVHRLGMGFGLMGLAGALSGLLGIGSGAMKVLAMDRAMRLPYKVSAATSNFMIVVTAAASAGVYLNRGYVDPGLAVPTVLGVLLGSVAGARIMGATRSRVLRGIFAVTISLLGIEMIYNGLRGTL